MSQKMPESEKYWLIQNPNQGPQKRVLCVCSGGILRSPTAAVVLAAPPYSFNTRAAGTLDFALIQVDHHLIGWADEILCMEEKHKVVIERLFQPSERYPKDSPPPIFVLNIPDNYDYRDPDLIRRIKRAYDSKETT
jgi:predicted protein tyrosine phosphatase